MRPLLANTTFRWLYLAQLVSLTGTGLMTVALGLLAYDLAGDDATEVLGTALAVKMVAYVAMAPVMRALLARIPATRVLIGADLVRVAMALCLPWVTDTWQVYLLIFALQTASATFTPTFSATIARVVPDERDYTAAVSASRVAYDLESITSPLIAGALLLVWSYSDLFVCTATGFVFSASLVTLSGLARIDRGAPAPEIATSLLRRITDGTRIMFGRGVYRGIQAANLVVAAATAVVMVSTVVYVRGTLHGSATMVAITLAAFGIGSIITTVTIPVLIRHLRITTLARLGAGLGVAGLGGTACWLGIGPSWAALLSIWVIQGVAMSLMNTTGVRLLRDHARADQLDDVFAAQFSTSHAAFLVTYALAGWGPTLLSPIGTVACLAVLATLGALGMHRAWATRRTTSTPHHAPTNPPRMNRTAPAR